MTLNNPKINSKTQNQLNFKIFIKIKSIISGDGKEKGTPRWASLPSNETRWHQVRPFSW